ncbi:hypothetical protein BCL79_0448 [Stenotrophomonas rhizophila]|uniref:Secreted protein n=1 Tax=Stenotrophomonas rhizophila TaxID=216778 RepID=A0A498CLR4_9GAMM|nr:hypothetical protein BCL79_0448 [Stenotrophomonas rhizophila]
MCMKHLLPLLPSLAAWGTVKSDAVAAAQALVADASRFTSTSAASADEAGFWPVISKPSLTTYEPQSGPLE